jgi:hypothetical protein
LKEQASPVIAHQIEHIIPRKHGGTDDLQNLPLACAACNLFKGANLAGFDPLDGSVVPLFHPRRDNWGEHFLVQQSFIEGCTPTGRATVAVLRMNDPIHLRLRMRPFS